MTIPDIEGIKARLAAATPGPWYASGIVTKDRDGCRQFAVTSEATNETIFHISAGMRDSYYIQSRADQVFCANAKQDIQALLSLVEQQRAEIGRMRPLYELYTVKPAQTASLAVLVNPNCTVCGGKMSLRFWDRPGGPPGNGYTCDTCHPPAHAGQEGV